MASDEVEAGEGTLGVIATSRLSRREVLKKGAIAGGAVAWALPTVEIVGTKIAAAASPGSSTTCGTTFYQLASFVPPTGETTLVEVTYTTNGTINGGTTETITIQPGAKDGDLGSGTIDSQGDPGSLDFTLAGGGTQLQTSLTSQEVVTFTVVQIVVNDTTQTAYSNSSNQIFGNCETFTITASSGPKP